MRSLRLAGVFWLTGVAWAAAPLPAQDAATSERVSVYVGVEKEVVDFVRPKDRVIPSPERAAFYAAEHSAPAGAPPRWLAEWTTQLLAGEHYVAAGAQAPWRLTFAWGAVDSQLTHIGRPIQFVVPGAQKIFLPRETKRGRAWATDAPFCVVTAYDGSAGAADAARASPLWRMKLWLVLVEVVPAGEVRVGPVQEKKQP